MDDRQIIDLLFARSEEGLKRLSDKCRNLCLKISGAILGSREDAEECFNDTLAQVWRTIPPERPENLTAYTAKITRNLSLNRYKRERTVKRGGSRMDAALSELEDCLAAECDEETKIVDRMAIKKAVNAFLRDLNERDREIFLRRYFSLETSLEIANRFGLKESAVRMILMRARTGLKEYLQKEGIQP